MNSRFVLRTTKLTKTKQAWKDAHNAVLWLQENETAFPFRHFLSLCRHRLPRSSLSLRRSSWNSRQETGGSGTAVRATLALPLLQILTAACCTCHNGARLIPHRASSVPSPVGFLFRFLCPLTISASYHSFWQYCIWFLIEMKVFLTTCGVFFVEVLSKLFWIFKNWECIPYNAWKGFEKMAFWSAFFGATNYKMFE